MTSSMFVRASLDPEWIPGSRNEGRIDGMAGADPAKKQHRVAIGQLVGFVAEPAEPTAS
jgi:hypothetical protein